MANLLERGLDLLGGLGAVVKSHPAVGDGVRLHHLSTHKKKKKSKNAGERKKKHNLRIYSSTSNKHTMRTDCAQSEAKQQAEEMRCTSNTTACHTPGRNSRAMYANTCTYVPGDQKNKHKKDSVCLPTTAVPLV